MMLIPNAYIHVLREDGKVSCWLSNSKAGHVKINGIRGVRDGRVEYPDSPEVPRYEDLPQVRSTLIQLGKVTIARDTPIDTHWRITKFWP